MADLHCRLSGRADRHDLGEKGLVMKRTEVLAFLGEPSQAGYAELRTPDPISGAAGRR